MSAIEQLAASHVLNAMWQMPLLYAVFAIVLKMRGNISATALHQAWLLCATLAVILPITGALGLYAPGPMSAGPSIPSVPSELWRIVFGLFVLTSAYRLLVLLHAGIEVWRVVRTSSAALVIGDPEIARVYVSTETARSRGPMVTGLFRPRILIPPALADPAKARLLKAALAHEYAHIARRDMWLFVVSEIVLVPLSFHPFTVLLRRRLAESREMACDERVIDQGMDQFEYARCLLAIGVDAVGATSPVGALGAGSSGLERRIAAIIAPRCEAAVQPGLRGWTAVVVCVAFCSTIVAEGSRSVFLWVSAVPAPPMVALLPPIPPPPPPPPPQQVRNDLR
jgi:hypothetical protein